MIFGNYNILKEYKLGGMRPQIFLFNREKTTLFCDDDATATGIICDDSWLLVADSVNYNVEIVEENRYLFQSSLVVTLSEHFQISNVKALQEILRKKWIIGIEDKMGGSYIINPEFNPQITYKYEINDSNERNLLTITFTFNQNIPCMRFMGVFSPSNKFNGEICEYGIGAVKSLKIGDYDGYSLQIDGDKFYIKDWNTFRDIDWLKGSFSYVDEYDGSKFTQTVNISIPWESYQYMLHYNLLEFINNKYVCVLYTSNENKIFVGYPNVLIPSYTISTGENNEPNIINISLKGVSSSFPILMSDKLEITRLEKPQYTIIKGECIDKVWGATLIGELDNEQNLTGNYYALKGYEDKDYNIVGTYDSIYSTAYGIKLYDDSTICDFFPCSDKIPSLITFTATGETQYYNLYSDCEFSVQFNPEKCTAEMYEGKIYITNLSEDDYYVTLYDSEGFDYIIQCQYKGENRTAQFVYEVDARSQDLDITTFFKYDDVSYIDSPIEFYANRSRTGFVYEIPENEITTPRVFVIKLTYITGQIEIIRIQQDQLYELIYTDGTKQCIDNHLWEMGKRLTGYKVDEVDIDNGYIPIRVVKYDAEECWSNKGYISSQTGTICVDNKVHQIIDYHDSNGKYQLTKLYPTDEGCNSTGTLERWEIAYDSTVCYKGVAYYKERRYVSVDGVNWYPSDYIKRSDVIAEDSNICDVVDGDNTGGLPLYRWVEYDQSEDYFCLSPDHGDYNCLRSEASNMTICVDGDLYKTYSEFIDPLCTDEWSFIGYQLGDLIESGSNQCDGDDEDILPPPSTGGTDNPDTGGTENPDTGSTDTGITEDVYTEEYKGQICGSEIGSAYLKNYIYDKYYIYVNGEYLRTEYRGGVYSSSCDNTATLSYEFTGDSSEYKINDVWQKYVGSSPLSVKLGVFGITQLTNCSDMFYKSNITKLIELPSTSAVTSMFGMFTSCSGLTSLDVSGFDTRRVTDMQGMFYQCTNLKSIDVSNFVTSGVTSMASMFRGCKEITSLDLSNFNVSKVTSIFSIFANSSKLKTINLNGWDLAVAKQYSGMFVGCSALTEISLYGASQRTIDIITEQLSSAGLTNVTLKTDSNPDTGTTTSNTLSFEFTGTKLRYNLNGTSYTATTSPYSVTLEELGINKLTSCHDAFSGQNITTLSAFPDTSNVTKMYSMFANCTGLTSLDLSNFDTSNVTNMVAMFESCKNLKSLNISNFNTSNVTDMGLMFDGCSALSSLDLSNFDTSNVTNMLGMFGDCSGLTSLDLSNFDTSSVNNMVAMFDDCKSLTSLDLSNFDTSNVNDMSGMFRRCSSLNTIYMKNCNATTISMIESALTEAGIRDNVTIITGSTTSTTSNVLSFEFTGDSAKYEIYPYIYTATESPFEITLSELGVDIWTNAHRLFCGDIARNPITRIISIPDTSNVTDMGQMFLYCSGLTSLDLSNFDTSNVTDMSGMFWGCSGLITLDLSSFDTSNVTDMSSMFYQCSGLTSIDLSSFNTSNVTDMGWMFNNCKKLTSLDLSNFNTSNVTDMSYMFGSCNGLTSLDLSNFNTSNVTNMDRMFAYCSSLNTIYMRNCNTTTKTMIETALTEAGYRDNVTIITE